jgi:4-hydroxybenzoate polyprenyltransferase
MEMTDRRPADAANSLVERLLPKPLWPYARLARLDRPVGWQLLLIPCLWSEGLAAIAQQRLPSLWHILLFAIGAIAMRGAGSTWNDFLDRDIDRQVARTRERPLANGSVTPRQALLFIVFQSLIGFAVLIQFNLFTILLGIGSLMLVALYPLAKRFTGHPQIVLGLVFSWGALVGWAAAFGSLAAAAYWLYAATVLWIIGYDTIYAMQDIEDDAIVGIGSTALTYGKSASTVVALCYLASALCFAMAMKTAKLPYQPLLIGAWTYFALGLRAQFHRLRQEGHPPPPATAMALFRSNVETGLMTALIIGAIAVWQAYAAS